LLLTAALLATPGASAATVAILKPEGSAAELGEAAFRIQGELLAVGLAVASAGRPPGRDTRSPEAQAWFAATAEARGLDAFIDVVGEESLVGVDVWLFEQASGRLKVTRILLERGAPNAVATSAIRAIEVLRSGLLVFDAPASRPAPRTPSASAPAEELPTTTTEGRARIGVAAGAAALASLDGIAPSLLPVVRLEWSVTSSFALQATAAGLGTRPQVSSDAGSAELAQRFALAGVCYCGAEPGLSPVLALSAGLLHVSLQGYAAAPNEAHRLGRWASLFEAGGGVRWSTAHRYQLTLAAHVQVAEPYVTVYLAESAVATTGRPNLLLSLTLGAWL